MSQQKNSITRRGLIKLRLKKVFLKIWNYVKSWQFIYLTLFFIGELLNIIFDDPSNVFSYCSPLILLLLSAITKMVMFKNKLTVKQFFKMQFDFCGPYVLTAIDIVLWVFTGSCLAAYFDVINGYLSYIIINSLELFFCTFICSLLMHRRVTTKFQYIGILIIIVMQVAANLISTISIIITLNTTIDSYNDLNQQYIVQFINKTITQDTYNQYYSQIASNISDLQLAKDFSLAQVASIISTLLVLLDMIGRPLQKIQQQQQICEVLLQKAEDDTNSQIKKTIRRYSNIQQVDDDIRSDESGIKKRITDYISRYNQKYMKTQIKKSPNEQNKNQKKKSEQKQSMFIGNQDQKTSRYSELAQINSKNKNKKQEMKNNLRQIQKVKKSITQFNQNSFCADKK